MPKSKLPSFQRATSREITDTAHQSDEAATNSSPEGHQNRLQNDDNGGKLDYECLNLGGIVTKGNQSEMALELELQEYDANPER